MGWREEVRRIDDNGNEMAAMIADLTARVEVLEAREKELRIHKANQWELLHRQARMIDALEAKAGDAKQKRHAVTTASTEPAVTTVSTTHIRPFDDLSLLRQSLFTGPYLMIGGPDDGVTRFLPPHTLVDHVMLLVNGETHWYRRTTHAGKTVYVWQGVKR